MIAGGSYYIYVVMVNTNNSTGLPQSERNRLENVHFLCCSNKVDALSLAKPLVDNLRLLEGGMEMYDAVEKQSVLVMAPLMLVMSDNPMSSDLCNHQGGSARKFCRFCLVSVHGSKLRTTYNKPINFMQVDRAINPETMGAARTKKQTLEILSAVERRSQIGEWRAMAARYGVRIGHNPLFQLNVDLHR